MKLLTLAAASVIALTTTALATTAFAQGSMGRTNLVSQTTVLNGPYGGDSNATTIAIRQRNEAAMTGRMRIDRLGYTKLLDLTNERFYRDRY